MLISRFEIIRMEKHETFAELPIKLVVDVVNSNFNLGEPIPNNKSGLKNFKISLEEI